MADLDACKDPHTLRWHCMRGHNEAPKGECPLTKCIQRGANRPATSAAAQQPQRSGTPTGDRRRAMSRFSSMLSDEAWAALRKADRDRRRARAMTRPAADGAPVGRQVICRTHGTQCRAAIADEMCEPVTVQTTATPPTSRTAGSLTEEERARIGAVHSLAGYRSAHQEMCEVVERIVADRLRLIAAECDFAEEGARHVVNDSVMVDVGLIRNGLNGIGDIEERA